MELINKEWKVFLSNLTTGDYQASRAGWIGSYLDPITFLDMWVTGSDLSTGGWSNTEFDGLIERAVRMAAGQERLQVPRSRLCAGASL